MHVQTVCISGASKVNFPFPAEMNYVINSLDLTDATEVKNCTPPSESLSSSEAGA